LNKKKLKIFGIILAFIICFPLHFIYDIFPNFLTSIFTPVNESIWEHMKILFGSIILSGVIQKIIVIAKKEKINNMCFSNFIAAITSIPIFLTIFLPIYKIIGENLIVNIILMLIVIIICEYIAYKITNIKDLKLENITILLVIIIYTIFGILTYYPPKNNLFIEESTNTYGIPK
jgi:hypothetical protein